MLPFLARKKVAFCMIRRRLSLTSTIKVAKPGAPGQLRQLVLLLLKKQHYVWLPRQHNWRADRLSKMIPTLWSLTNWDHSQLWALCPLVATLVDPDFNCILHSLHTWRLCSAGWTLLVHPVWPLPPANRCLLSSTVISPPWPMRASLLYFP